MADPSLGPTSARAVLEVPHLARGMLSYFAGLSRRYPVPLVHIRLGPGGIHYLVNHPDTVREMLVQVPERFSRSRWLGPMWDLVGAGLLTSDETAWVDQRRRLNPAYGRDHVAVVEAATLAEVEACLEQWRRAPDGVVDVQADVKEALLRALVAIMFSPDARVEAEQMVADLEALQDAVSVGSFVKADLLRRVGLGARAEARVQGVLKRIGAFVSDLIDGCRAGRYAPGLLLAPLLVAEERGDVDPKNLHDEVGTLLLAGFDTTAALVTFALGALARRPDLQSAVLEDAFVPGWPYLDLVLRETLRLYPPVWAIHRTVAEPIEIGGHPIEPGIHVMACPYALHRNPAFWTDPEAFRPERFEKDARPGLEYLPFSHGRHTCIGKRMALQQAGLFVGAVLEAFEIAPVGREPRLVPGVVLRAAGGLPLRVSPR